MNTSENGDSIVPAERFNIRFMALGAFLIFLVLTAAEWLVWRLVDENTQSFFYESIARVSASDITAEEKDAIRAETLQRLAVPSILGLGAIVFIAPFGVGMLVGKYSRSYFSAPLAVVLGGIVTLIASKTFSLGAIVACLLYGSYSVFGHATVKKLQNWHTKT
ncbi:MAG: hypothetical protein JXX14_10255 [Deltaproteobacteria bacterium]|nr:hypothetical protein [Deltaproteobacteria bacterium]